MKRIGLMFVAILATLLFAGGSFAAGMESSSGKMNSKQAVSSQQKGHIISASRFIGMDVNNQRGDKIGEVQDLVLNRQSGEVDYVVISAGGFWGIGEDRHAVPFKAFKAAPEENALTLTIDENRLANAPKVRKGMTEDEYSRQINEYYGQAPAFEGQPQEKGMQKQQKKESY